MKGTHRYWRRKEREGTYTKVHDTWDMALRFQILCELEDINSSISFWAPEHHKENEVYFKPRPFSVFMTELDSWNIVWYLEAGWCLNSAMKHYSFGFGFGLCPRVVVGGIRLLVRVWRTTRKISLEGWEKTDFTFSAGKFCEIVTCNNNNKGYLVMEVLFMVKIVSQNA